MNQISNPPPTKRVHDFDLEHFRIRLTVRLCIALICLIQMALRLSIIIPSFITSSTARLFLAISLPFPLLMTFVIALEYILYRKLGSGIIKYSSFVDIMLLIFFTADWVTVVISHVHRVDQGDPACYSAAALIGFTTFAWRTLMVTLIVEKWQLKIIAPLVALSVAVGFAGHYNTAENAWAMVVLIVYQYLSITLIVICEDKVKWRMLWASIQKDKWTQVNNFILNSIPENIMILDLYGEAKFISEYCKCFINNCHLSVNPKDFFRKVQDLQKLDSNSPCPFLQTERLTTGNGLLGENLNRDQNLEDLVSNFQRMMRNKEIQEREFLIYNGKLNIEDQQDKSLEVKISFVQQSENYYIILILRDTTQRDLLVTLEETNKYKDQLLASVSHELRAPLNGNINLVESAINSRKTPECIKESFLIPALRSSKFLLHMINDILDMSQIKEKKLRLVFQSGNLKETLKSTAQLVELQAKKKGFELLLEIDSSIPKKFSTDHIRLSQIILNLLNNAIKFTKEGVVKLIATSVNNDFVRISVQDSGIGMTEENVKKLFSSYTHIEFEGRKNMNPTGVGLGLNIAYNLAVLLGPDLHQGINVTSVPGEGSTFTFIIENKNSKEGLIDSCEISDESSESIQPMHFTQLKSNGSLNLIAEKSESVPITCSCAKVLVVDDNPFNTMACETILSSLEIKCDSVFSGSACIKSLLNRQTTKSCGENCKQYAVIFMDQEMPEMSGSETVKEIIKLQNEGLLSSSIKVIGCTAHKSKEELAKFMEAGIDRCISKPITAVVINDILKGIV